MSSCINEGLFFRKFFKADLGAKNGYRCVLMGISKNEALEKFKIQ